MAASAKIVNVKIQMPARLPLIWAEICFHCRVVLEPWEFNLDQHRESLGRGRPFFAIFSHCYYFITKRWNVEMWRRGKITCGWGSLVVRHLVILILLFSSLTELVDPGICMEDCRKAGLIMSLIFVPSIWRVFMCVCVDVCNQDRKPVLQCVGRDCLTIFTSFKK